MLKISLIVASSILFTGCASVINDVTHPMKVEAKTEAGNLVAGADCKLSNDYGVFAVKSGEVVQVRRSSKDLEIECKDSVNPNAVGRAISRVNGGMIGNILLGGPLGIVIDHNKGTAYSYPLWVQLIFGRTLVFDRRVEVEDKPTPGVAPELAGK